MSTESVTVVPLFAPLVTLVLNVIFLATHTGGRTIVEAYVTSFRQVCSSYIRAYCMGYVF